MTPPQNSIAAREFDFRRWAAEELALQLGWLCECPYHGEPFKSSAGLTAAAATPQNHAALEGGRDRDLYSLAAEISKGYGERCSFCDRENVLPE
jgi:hypothetical protein